MSKGCRAGREGSCQWRGRTSIDRLVEGLPPEDVRDVIASIVEEQQRRDSQRRAALEERGSKHRRQPARATKHMTIEEVEWFKDMLRLHKLIEHDEPRD